MSKLAKIERKSLQIKEGMLPMGNIWVVANKHGNDVVSKLQQLAAPMIKAGAAFWILKSKTAEGQWLDTLAAHSSHDRTAVWRWMQTAEHALQHIGYAVEERAMLAIIADTQDDFGVALLSALNDAIAGKSRRQLQLEFGIRKPAHPLLPPGAATDDLTDEQRAARRLAAEISKHKRAFEDSLAHLQTRLADLTDADRAAIGYACAAHVAFLLPDGWKLQVLPHTGKPMTVEQVFAEHLGLHKP
jgi:hypothetical protein